MAPERHPRSGRVATVLVLAWVLGGFPAACRRDDSPLSGGTSSETVIGRVVSPGGAPAAGAAYRLRAVSYLRNPADPAAAKAAVAAAKAAVAAAKTAAAAAKAAGAAAEAAVSPDRRPALGQWDGSLDSGGNYRIDSLEAGEYRLEVRLGGGLGLLLPVAVRAGAGTVDMGRDVLSPLGHLSGAVVPVNSGLADSAFRHGHVQLFGVERVGSIGTSGGIGLPDLAPGRYDLRVFSAFPFPQVAELPGVEIRPGETTDVGEIRLNRILGASFTSLVPDGLVAYWPFDEGGGAAGVDPVGGNDARLRGDPAWTAGVRGQALRLDGVDDYAVIPALYLDGDFSVAAWVRLEGRIENNQMLMSRTDSANLNFAFGRFRLFRGERKPAWDPGLYPDDPPWDVAAARTAVTAGVWTHVMVTRAAGALTVYTDGRPDGTGTWSGTLPLNEIGRGPLDTGAPVAPGNLGYLQGALDELRIYARALTAAEAASLADGKPLP